MKSILFLTLCVFSTNIFAADFSCLKNSRFTQSINPDGSYNPDDELGDIYFSLKANNKYLILDTRGEQYNWMQNGAYIVLKRKGKSFVSNDGGTIVHPFCKDKELYLEFRDLPSGGAFLGQVN